MTSVGFIGLGSQGGPMARRIIDEGFPLTIWARRPDTLEPFDGTGASVAPTPRALGEASDIVGICVVADADVEAVVLGDQGVLAGMKPGSTLLIHSTVHPRTCGRIAASALALGVGVLDAPVSGGGGAASQRALLVMVGGAEEVLDRCRPVLETFGNPILHLGPLGSGLTAKLLNNVMFTAHLALAREAFELAERLGMDRAALGQVLAHGSGGSRAAATMAASGFNTAGLSQAAALLRKDVGLVQEVLAEAEVPEPPTLFGAACAALDSLEGRPEAR